MKYAGAVYLLRVGNSYKIGCSKNPDKRIRQLQTGSSASIQCAHLLPTNYYQQIESQLHAKFADKRDIGEWFHLEAEDVAYIRSLNENGLTQQEQLERNRAWRADQDRHSAECDAACREEARQALSIVAAV